MKPCPYIVKPYTPTMATLTPGQNYLLLFPASNFSSIFKLIETHNATERYHTLYTFHDSASNIVKFTKGVFNSISIVEWHAPVPTPPATPPPKRANQISMPDLPPVPQDLRPAAYQRRPSYVSPPVPVYKEIYRDVDFDELYN